MSFIYARRALHIHGFAIFRKNETAIQLRHRRDSLTASKALYLYNKILIYEFVPRAQCFLSCSVDLEMSSPHLHFLFPRIKSLNIRAVIFP
jgi:hypothetical protein